MNAIEFVKKFGWTKAKECLSFGKNYTDADLVVRYANLKQIVEAFELVEAHGGLDDAKYVISYPNFLNDKDVDTFNMSLKQAIELVEKCNASD